MGLNGVGIKAVNALSGTFTTESIRDGQMKKIDCIKGELSIDYNLEDTSLRNGTRVTFIPDNDIFKNFSYLIDHVENRIFNYVYLNSGLTISLNNKNFI